MPPVKCLDNEFASGRQAARLWGRASEDANSGVNRRCRAAFGAESQTCGRRCDADERVAAAFARAVGGQNVVDAGFEQHVAKVEHPERKTEHKQTNAGHPT